MNKTELKVFLKGLANFYVVLMIIAFLPTPGKDCSPGRLVRCIAIYTIVSIVIFSAVYFWNRIRKGPDKRPDTCPVPDAKETKDDDLSISRFLTLRNMGACFIYFLCVFALLYPEMSLESMLKASARSTGYYPCPARGRNRLLCLSKSCRQEKVDPGKVVAASGGHRASRFFGYAGIRRDGRAEIARRKNSPGLIFYS